MKIEHVALWTDDIERLSAFYQAHFGALPGPLYQNPAKGFTSRFLSLLGGGRIELMRREGVQSCPAGEHVGYAHLALSLGSVEAVEQKTAELREKGAAVISGPRWTGDGYFESVVLDPDGNLLELTV